jgi:hypothetical protein
MKSLHLRDPQPSTVGLRQVTKKNDSYNFEPPIFYTKEQGAVG